MSHDDQGQTGASGHSVPVFLFGAKEATSRREVPRKQPKVSIPVQQDQDREDGRTEVINEPTTTSRPESFAGQYYFCQDCMY